MNTKRTVQQWFALDDDKLIGELSKMQPKPWKHATLSRLNESGRAWCRKCKRWVQFECESPKLCPVPDPINIKDWNAAKYWQGKCGIYAFSRHALEVVKTIDSKIEHTDDALNILALLCKPEDAKYVLVIAAMAAERKETRNG